LIEGIDPVDARKAEREAQALEAAKAITFEQAAQQYFDQHERKWRNEKHRQQFLSTLKAYAFPKIGRLSASAVDTGQVLRCLEPIWRDKTETASRLRARIENVLDWATVRGYRKGENPARWKGHLDTVLPARSHREVRHHAALPYAEMPEFYATLQERDGVAVRALEFTILTAARTGETIGARLNEIDLATRIWTVPAGRIKGGREHRVPLCDRAVEILQALPTEEGNAYVFIGSSKGAGLSNMAMTAVLKRLGRGGITTHGFRSTFRDWAAERTGYPNHVVEMALAHVIGDKVEAAYRRGDLFDKRRKLMADWARFCATKLPTQTENILPLRRA
jgi:integrase